jgi:hypothetical protein
MTSNQGIRYNDKWFTFASDQDAYDARQQIAAAISPLSGPPKGTFITALNNGIPVQLLITPGIYVVFQGKWSAQD